MPEHNAAAQNVDPALVNAMNRFAVDFYARLAEVSSEDSSNAENAEPSDNRMISPAGLTFALSMLRGGAAGETAAEMDEAMRRSGISDEQWDQGQRILLDRLQASDPSLKMEIADAVWSREGFKLDADYVKRVEKQYEAQVRSLDFSSPEAAATINRWAADHTAGKIPKVIDDSLLEGAKLILMNAMYFKGEWSEPFDPDLTIEQEFHAADGTALRVPMMRNPGMHDYLKSEGFAAVRLPYGESGSFGMVLALPDEDRSLGEFLRTQLTHFSEWNAEWTETPGMVELPKFRLKNSLDLVEPLRRQGLSLMFDPARADLSGVAPETRPGELYASSVKQDTYLEVNEDGTEAAAVTMIVEAGSAAPTDGPEPFDLKLNRPFFFAITDRESGLILFMGEVGNPAEK